MSRTGKQPVGFHRVSELQKTQTGDCTILSVSDTMPARTELLMQEPAVLETVLNFSKKFFLA